MVSGETDVPSPKFRNSPLFLYSRNKKSMGPPIEFALAYFGIQKLDGVTLIKEND